MDLSKRLGLDTDLLKAATKVLEGKKSEPKEEPKQVKEETQLDEFVICVVDRHNKDSYLDGFENYNQALAEATKLRKTGSWRKVSVINLAEFSSGDPTTPNAAVARVRDRLSTSSLARRVAGRLATGAVGVAADIALNPSSTDNNDAEMRDINDRWNAMSPEQRRQHRQDNGIPEPETTQEPEAQTQTQAEPEARAEPARSDNDLPPPPPEPPARQEPQQQRTAAPASTTRREQPRAQDNDNVADRLNAISLGQSVADRGGTPEPDAAPQDDKEREAADNMRRRRNEIANEETIVEKDENLYDPKKKKEKSKSPGVVFNPETPVNEEAGGGKIKSSRRITKALQDIINKGVAKDFKFEDGTTIKIEPSMARIALQKYNALNDFQRAKAAKTMRNSYKEFLAATRGH